MANATLPFFAASGSPSVLGTVDQSYFSGFLASHGLMQPDTPSIDAFYGLLATASAAFGGGALGDYLVFLLFTVFPFKIFRTLGIWFFLWADRTGFLDAYRIQDKGRQPSPAQVDAMYKAQVSNWHLGFLLVELPLTTAFYLLRVSLGYSIHSRDPGGWSQVAWKFVWALIVYDTWVWAWHVACHVSPYM